MVALTHVVAQAIVVVAEVERQGWSDERVCYRVKESTLLPRAPTEPSGRADNYILKRSTNRVKCFSCETDRLWWNRSSFPDFRWSRLTGSSGRCSSGCWCRCSRWRTSCAGRSCTSCTSCTGCTGRSCTSCTSCTSCASRSCGSRSRCRRRCCYIR